MSKELTEKWKNGELDLGWYYIKIYWGAGYDTIFDYNTANGEFAEFGKKSVKEILAPVPTYEEYKELKKSLSKAEEYCDYSIKNKMDLTRQITAHLERIERLQEQLAIAIKALKGVSLWANTGNGGEQAVKKVCDKALKEIEGVK